MAEKLKQAESFAKNIYKDKKRLSGESVYSHINKVRYLLTKIGVQDENVLIACIFHHVISENMREHIGDIEKKFGKKVTEILSHFDKISNLQIKLDSPKNLNKEYIIQTYLNLSNDLNVLLILLVDKVEGSKTLHALPPEKKKESANRCLYIYAPVCRLVGLGKFAAEIEKNGFKTLYPGEYYRIKRMLEDRALMTRNYLRNIKELLLDYFKEKDVEAIISFRIKSEYSIFNKSLSYKNKRKASNYSDIKDVAALRIIVDTVEQCYLIEDMLKDLWKHDDEERDDYIANPKPTGYQSIHTLFFIEEDFPLEVQIRTKVMHDFNEFGNASHIFYKYSGKFKKNLSKNPDWLKTLNFKKAEEVSDLQHFSEKVYVFTPKGDIIELPRGACALDFAYEIHEDLGNKCVGALVNGEIKKLSYKLQDGEKIEIRITNKLNVNRDWFDFIITQKAKKCMRRVFREDIR